MELNFPPWLFTWNQFFFMIYVLLAIVPTTRFIAENNSRIIEKRPELGIHIFGKVGLDIALIMGISGSAIALMGSLHNFEPDIDPYFQASYVVGTMLMGAGLTGASFCFSNRQLKEPMVYKLEKQQAMKLVALVSAVALIQMYICEINFLDFWKFGWTLIFQFFVLTVWASIGSLTGKPLLRCIVESNVAATFMFLAVGIVFWFAEGGDYLNSRNNIFVLARTLFIGAFIHVVLYYISLFRNETHLGDYKTKTWHFAEASSFVVFLILAPVGLTEYSRESKDQAALQKQHEAQQLEINQLKAQIKLLTEKVGEV